MKLGKVIENESKKYIAENGTAPTLAILAERFNTTEETIETSLKNMQEAKEKLITSNQKLVVHIAKFYMFRGVPFGALMQEASNGMWQHIVYLCAMRSVNALPYRLSAFVLSLFIANVCFKTY